MYMCGLCVESILYKNEILKFKFTYESSSTSDRSSGDKQDECVDHLAYMLRILFIGRSTKNTAKGLHTALITVEKVQIQRNKKEQEGTERFYLCVHNLQGNFQGKYIK